MTSEEANARKGSEIQLEEVLSTFSPQDRENLTELANAFTLELRTQGRNGALIIAGGAINKRLPRKDIDIIVVFEPSADDLTRENSQSYYDFALNDFRRFKSFVERLISHNLTFAIKETIEPVMDEEFQNPSILKNEGTVTLSRGGTTPIELIRTREKGVDTAIANQKQKFCVLTRF